MSSDRPTSAQLLRPVLRLLEAAFADRGLFWRSTASMSAYQFAAAAAAGLSTFIATIVVADPHGAQYVPLLIFALIVAVTVNGVFIWVESWLSHVLAYRILGRLRMRLHDAIERISPGGMKHRRAGEVAGSTMSDVENLEWFYAHTVGAAINAALGPLLVTVALVVLTGPAGLIVLAGVAAYLAVPWLLGGLQARQGRAVRAELGELKAITLEGAEGLREILSLGLDEYQKRRVLATTRRVQRRKLAFALRSGAEGALADVVVALTTVSFLLVLATRVQDNALNPLVFPAAIVLLAAAFAPATGVFAMFQRLGDMSAAAQRVLDVLDASAPVTDPAQPREPTTSSGALRFADVNFGYGDTPVLRELDLDIEPGQTVALVGESGAGKTTIAHLLVRFWDPTSGHILLDGVSLRDMTQEQVRQRVALIGQHPYLFRGSVRSNLHIAAPQATESELWAALEDAQLAPTVRSWPQGLDQLVGEGGATMSGGQRQRLAIAQAFLRSPSVLVMDEAVAHLDAAQEQQLASALARVRHNRTTVVIAHRVSTIRHADRVVFLDHGRIVATGTHDHILATCEQYRSVLAHAEAPELAAQSSSEKPRGDNK
ncbi:ABC transporter ATP-binding protein [Natronoglycomyces albus]|uniref:ABC transporter ATP-binding protein n=1 Tax=Natronoglycomyces albus TaxID=2811108 RepID=A0A895XEB9_9ACTN|nr:ABC transporter ATP-binding protein [Natronoglycomyces albus]QSB04171.1 ABC transporter ATP-binding protein [Natronoglycomyces albus]